MFGEMNLVSNVKPAEKMRKDTAIERTEDSYLQ